MKKFYSIIALMLLFVGSAWGQTTTQYLTNLGDAKTSINEVTVTADTKPIILYLNGDNTNTNALRKSYLKCSSSASNATLELTTTAPTTGLDVTDYLFYITPIADTTSTYYYIKASNNEYISAKDVSGNTLQSSKTALITTTLESDAAIFTFSLTSRSTTPGIFWIKNGELYLNSQNSGSVNYWSGSAELSMWSIFVPELSANPISTVNVTYKLVDDNGNSLSSLVPDVESAETVGATPSAPSSFENDFVRLSTNIKTIEESTTEIIYTAALSEDCPIKFSTDYNNAVWYQVTFGTSTSEFWAFNEEDVSSNSNLSYKLVDNAIDKVNDNALWAFSGNPYEVHIWNKGAGADKELHSCQNSRPLLENTNSYNNIDLSNNATEMARVHKWTVWEMQATTSTNGQFAFHVPDGGNSYLNRYGGNSNRRLGIWTDGNAHNDPGSAITIATVTYPNDIFNNISTDVPQVVENPKWGDIASYTGNADAFTSAKEAYTTAPSETSYDAVIDNLNYTFGQGANASVYNVTYKGSDGFVNIAGASTNANGVGNSIGLKTGDESGHIHGQTTDLNDANQLWIVTSPSAGTVNLFNVNAQRYMGPNVGGSSNTVSLRETAVNWTIEWKDDDTTFILKSGTDQFDHLNYEGGAGNVGNLNHWSGNDTWAATPVASINLPVHAVGDYSYATICYPFSVTLSDGEGYTGNINTETGNLTLTSIGQTIPAGTPVVVVVDNATTTSITATINDGKDTEVSPLASSALSGTYLPKTIAEDGELTLGVYDNAAGFYHWGGTIQNKAYLNSSATSKGFAFSFGGDDDPTGISEELIKEAVKELQGQRYNVQGQPVGADYKGIIIQNGKKYLQK